MGLGSAEMERNSAAVNGSCAIELTLNAMLSPGRPDKRSE
jgi:hypothetical protein